MSITVTETDAGTIVASSPTPESTVVVSQMGVAGPPGPAGASASSYMHVQGVPDAVWTIAHDLGFRPNVTVLDSTGRVVEGDLSYPDANTLVLTFSAAFAGTAYLS